MASVATLGSHCALQVLKGAKDEGFETLLVCERRREGLYRRFKFIDRMILVDSFQELLWEECQSALLERDAVLVPHGTLIAQMSPEQIESVGVPMFGNRHILRWESDRELKARLMVESGLNVPQKIDSPDKIDGLVIAKRQGAAGGKGYFMASSPEEYARKREMLVRQGTLPEDEPLYIQRYITGVLAYLQYFYSPLSCELEFFGVDRRHESDIEGLSRIPAELQITRDTVPSFNVIANSPMVLRESLLEEVYGMGERFVEASKRLAGPGMNGPFCIEGVYDSDAEFTAFEFSARIVAGTNIYMEGSPYSALLYGEPMSMGRRIARELAMAARSGRIGEVTT
jgi:5-formaminoimidazole-4-carboxamide-1-(beta)-D-ribofuranosyl 5'-monophosphate synthetase